MRKKQDLFLSKLFSIRKKIKAFFRKEKSNNHPRERHDENLADKKDASTISMGLLWKGE